MPSRRMLQNKTTSIAATACPKIFAIGCKGIISSRNPRKKRIIREATINKCCCSKYPAAQNVNENIVAAKIAIPPSKGIRFGWSLRSSGSSYNSTFFATRIREGIDASAMMKAVMAAERSGCIGLENGKDTYFPAQQFLLNSIEYEHFSFKFFSCLDHEKLSKRRMLYSF